MAILRLLTSALIVVLTPRIVEETGQFIEEFADEKATAVIEEVVLIRDKYNARYYVNEAGGEWTFRRYSPGKEPVWIQGTNSNYDTNDFRDPSQ